VASAILPGKPDSGGAQFFICVADQPALEGQYTILGRVVEGLGVVRAISQSALDAKGKLVDRVEIKSVVIRDKPPPEPEPFSQESAAELAAFRVVLETSAGNITLALRPDKAPEHVRNFLRLASAGVYDKVGIHRVVRGFVVQTGAMAFRSEPLDERQQKLVKNLSPEPNDLRHIKGALSMARGDDPASASTSFFICLAAAKSLDGKYTVFGSVVDGLPVVGAIEAVAVDGEMPKARIEVVRARVEKGK
jgi:peptidyl-prolyl cis-trans isomerase B (cyclophilin B)